MADIDPILSLIQQAIPIAKMLASLTATQWDDRAVSILEAAANSPQLINLLRVLLDDPVVVSTSGQPRTAAIQAACENCAATETVAAAEASGIGWVTLVQYLPLIIRLLLSVSGKRA